MLLSEIKPEHVEQFSLWLRDEKGLSGKSVNNNVSVLSVMLKEAYRLGKLNWNPNEKGIVRKVGVASKQRGRFSIEEINALFAEENFEKCWKGHRLYWLVNYIAAQTGMRIGEVLALWDEDVFPDHLHVAHSYSCHYGRGTTKTKEVRDVPITPSLYKLIEPFLGTGKYVLSQTRGERPATPNLARQALIRALEALGIDWKARGLSFHSWRHTMNSILRSNGIADPLTQRMIGHISQEMTERYTEFLPEDFAGIAEIQKKLFG
jgi:integrase